MKPEQLDVVATFIEGSDVQPSNQPCFITQLMVRLITISDGGIALQPYLPPIRECPNMQMLELLTPFGMNPFCPGIMTLS